MSKEIPFWPRTVGKKSEVKRLRREGYIPAIIYSRGKDEAIYVSKRDFDEIIRELTPGFLPTTVFHLKNSSGAIRKGIVKDIHYNVTNYDVMHLDFLELQEGEMIDVKVPIECLNQVDCTGVKAGGYVRILRRHLKVRCLPSHLPTHFEVDVKEVDLGGVRRIADIALPTQVMARENPRELVMTVAKR